MSTYHEADGKPVVVQNGQRIGGVHESQQSAQKAAAEVNKKLTESSANSQARPQPKAEVKTNLYG